MRMSARNPVSLAEWSLGPSELRPRFEAPQRFSFSRTERKSVQSRLDAFCFLFWFASCSSCDWKNANL